VVAASLTQLPHRCTRDSGGSDPVVFVGGGDTGGDLPADASRVPPSPSKYSDVVSQKATGLAPELGSGGGLSFAKHFRAQIKSSPVNPALQRPNRTARGASDFLIAPLFDGNQAKGLLLVPG
jgi:hypothetical protein